MTKLTAFEDVLAALNRVGRGISNDYNTPGGLRAVWARGDLEALETVGGVFLLARRDGYRKLFFRVRDEAAALPDIAPPVVAYTVYKNAPEDGAAERWLAANGFAVRQARLRMTAVRLSVTPSADGVGVCGQDEAYPVFARCFDLLAADLPRAAAFEGAYCVREGGRVVAALAKGAGRHLAVLPAYRGRGLATRLYAALAAEDCGQIRVWTDADNAAAQALYRKLGFEADGATARCYLRET